MARLSLSLSLPTRSFFTSRLLTKVPRGAMPSRTVGSVTFISVVVVIISLTTMMSTHHKTTSTSASAIFASTLDLVIYLVPSLDRASLYPVLLSSKTFATAVLPRLYRTLPIKPNRPCLLYHDDYDANLVVTKGVEQHQDSWSRGSCFPHVRSLAVYVHGTASCPGTRTDRLPGLPNLEHIHIASGEQTLDMGKPCEPDECPLIQHYAAKATRLTTRKLQALPPFPNLVTLAIVIRPCQLPFEARGGAVHFPTLFRPVENVENVDIVVWDESHNHRIDWIHHTRPNQPIQTHLRAKMTAGFAPRSFEKTHGCKYCDQSGCLRYSPNVPHQLPGIAYSATRYSKKAKRIRVWNADKSAMEMQWFDTKMDLEGFRMRIKAEVERGVAERESTELSTSMCNGPDEVVLSFGDAGEWVEKMRLEGREDEMEGEEEYWTTLLEQGRGNRSPSVGLRKVFG